MAFVDNNRFFNNINERGWILEYPSSAQHIPGDDYIYEIKIIKDPDDILPYENFIYFNSKLLSKFTLNPNNYYECNVSEASGKVIFLHIDPTFNRDIDIEVKTGSVVKNIQYRPVVLDNDELMQGDYMNNKNVSFQLLRVNPKLTGNIKVVVDSESNMYMDTFKVSDTLSQYNYRHIAVNPDIYYGNTLMYKFSSMPSGDFYKIENRCYDLFSTVQKYDNQYYDIYNSGVRTNNDRLYNENFSILAPLCVKSIMPDFFLVFKIKNIEKIKNKTEKEKINYFLSNGELVKSFDMRTGTNLGKYIRNIYNNACKYPGDMFISYDSNSYNKISGISIDKGVTTQAFEPVFDERKNIVNQVSMDVYYTGSFERNRLVIKDIVNFEFMFDDKDEKLFSVNNYFGLYVKLNKESDDFSCLSCKDGVYSFTSNIQALTPDSSSDTLLDTSLSSLIYGVSTPNEFIRLKKSLCFSDINEKFMMKPHKTILKGKVSVSEKNTYTECTVFTLDKPLNVGDHIRIINKEKHIIYDLILSNSVNYAYSGYSSIIYNQYEHNEIIYDIKRISIYTPYTVLDNETDYAKNIKDQISRMFSAINLFNDGNIMAYAKNNNSMSVLCFSHGCIFEHICSEVSITEEEKERLKDYDKNIITLFNDIKMPKIILESCSKAVLDANEFFYLYPLNMDILGTRIGYACEMIPTMVYGNNFSYKIFYDKITDLNTPNIIYRKSNNSYETYKGFNAYQFKMQDDAIIKASIHFNYVYSYNLDDSYYISVVDPYISNNLVSFYSMIPLNAGFCSILQMKDFDTDILDPLSSLSYNEIPVGKYGEFSEISVYGTKLLDTPEEHLNDYIDNKNSISTDYIIDASNRHDYFKKLINNNHIYSDSPLIMPSVCKWCGNGTDARGVHSRVMYDFNNIESPYRSYYLPVYNSSDIMFNTNVGFICNNIDNSKYVKNHINSLVKTDTRHLSHSVKDLILDGSISIDSLVYNNINDNKYSYVYKAGNNKIEFISGGVKVNISSANQNVIDFNQFDDYMGTFISMSGTNSTFNTPYEIIIDKQSKKIVVIWYNANTDLSYINEFKTYRIMHTSSLTDCIITESNNDKYLHIPTDNEDFTRLDSSNNYVLLYNNAFSKNTEFSTLHKIVIIGKIDSIDNDYIKIKNPVIWHGNDYDGDINKLNEYLDNYHLSMNMYIYSNNNTVETQSDFRNFEKIDTTSDIFSVYIIDDGKSYSYNNLDGIFSLKTVKPFECKRYDKDSSLHTSGYTLGVFAEPVTKNMFGFDYNNPIINAIYGNKLNGKNIIINDVKNIEQLPVCKYTDKSDYCITSDASTTYKTSVDFTHNISIMDDCFNNPVYRNYNDITDKTCMYLNGYETGCETTTFLGSRGMNLNSTEDGSEIIITGWFDTKVMYKEKYIVLNITDSIIYNTISFKEGFNNNWAHINILGNSYKINYIKNYIMKFIDINSNTLFKLYIDNNSTDFTFNDTDTENMVEITNVKNELKYENGKYMMYIYPDENKAYYAEMYIKTRWDQ